MSPTPVGLHFFSAFQEPPPTLNCCVNSKRFISLLKAESSVTSSAMSDEMIDDDWNGCGLELESEAVRK